MSPRAHTSVAGEIVAPGRSCSGAIHKGEPSICEFLSVPFASCAHLAMPKSRILSVKGTSCRRAAAKKRFSGFRSRCTRPSVWACSSTCFSCRAHSRREPRLMGPWASTCPSRVSPRRSSMTSQGMFVSGSTPAASTSTTWSLSIEAEMRASLSKRTRWAASAESSMCMTLRARSLPVESCSTTKTEPIPPDDR